MTRCLSGAPHGTPPRLPRWGPREEGAQTKNYSTGSGENQAAGTAQRRGLLVRGAGIQDPRKKIAVCALPSAGRLRNLSGSLFDAAEHHSGISCSNPVAAPTDIVDQTLQFLRKVPRGLRDGTMLVDDAAAGGFEGRGQRAGGFNNVVVVERLKILWRVSRDEATQEQQESRLRIGQSLQCRCKRCEVPLLLTLHNSRGMTARRGQIAAIARASDLNKTLRAAADGADCLAYSRTLSSSFPSIAEWTEHRTALYVGRARIDVRRPTRRVDRRSPRYYHCTTSV